MAPGDQEGLEALEDQEDLVVQQRRSRIGSLNSSTGQNNRRWQKQNQNLLNLRDLVVQVAQVVQADLETFLCRS